MNWIYIILIVGFIVTWIVIAVSSTDVPTQNGCHKHHDYFTDPFHTCEYTEQKKLTDRLEAENYRLRREIRDLQFNRPVESLESLLKPQITAEELLKLLQKEDELPKELKINDKKYKQQK